MLQACMNLDVIIIDDDAIVLFLHKTLLKKCGFASTISAFSSGEDALEFLRETKTSKDILILLDINMPMMSGWDFLSRMNQDERRCSVAMVTSSINESDKNKAKDYPPVIAFLEKPLSGEDLMGLFNKVRNI